MNISTMHSRNQSTIGITRTAGRTLAWCFWTLIWIGVAPFIVLAFIYWVAVLAGNGSAADIHSLVVSLATTAPHDAWATISPQLSVIFWLPSIVAFVVRVATMPALKGLGDNIDHLFNWIGGKLKAPMQRRGITPPAVLKRHSSLFGPLVLATIVVGALFAVAIGNDNNSPMPPPFTQPANIPATAAIRLPDGRIYSGAIQYERQDGQWVIDFGVEQKQ